MNKRCTWCGVWGTGHISTPFVRVLVFPFAPSHHNIVSLRGAEVSRCQLSAVISKDYWELSWISKVRVLSMTLVYLWGQHLEIPENSGKSIGMYILALEVGLRLKREFNSKWKWTWYKYKEWKPKMVWLHTYFVLIFGETHTSIVMEGAVGIEISECQCVCDDRCARMNANMCTCVYACV